MCRLNNRFDNGFNNGCNTGCNNGNRRDEAIELIERGAARIREGLCEIKRCHIRAGICECERGLADIFAGLEILRNENNGENGCNCGRF